LPRTFSLALALFLTAVSAGAQAPERIATTADALIANPIFFHGKRIVVRHALRQTDRLAELDATGKPIFVFWKDPPTTSDGEIRGEFWDLGRLEEGDGRFASYDFRPVLDAANNGRWPARDQIFVLLGATFVPGQASSAATVRAIALAPEQFDNRSVTLVGRFKGRNLFGDLPQGVAKSKWDFVLQSADAAVWVTNLRPKGKDFDLNPDARVDTGRWLEITGTVHRMGSAIWVSGESVRLATAPSEPPAETAAPSVPREPAPAVIFSAPLADETDFPVDGRIRIQFSRDMNGASFRGQVSIRYTGAGAPAPSPPTPTVTYNDGNRSIEIRFKEPLQRLQAVTIQLGQGITAIDGQSLQPWSLRFTTGG
jgi:hypothetical protein